MTLIPPILSSGSGGGVAEAAICPFVNTSNIKTPPGTGYAGLRWGSDGEVYRYNAAGSFHRIATWMQTGANTDYFLKRTIDEGTLQVDAGEGPTVMSSNRDFAVTVSGPLNTRSCYVTFAIFDSAGETIKFDERQYRFYCQIDDWDWEEGDLR